MKKVAEEKPDLNLEQRNLLSVAYKNIVGARRASFRIVSSILSKEEEKDASSHTVVMIKSYKAKASGAHRPAPTRATAAPHHHPWRRHLPAWRHRP